MTAAIIIAMLVGHQPDIPITYQGPTARLSEVMSEVGKQAGATIKVVGAPERDFVYLNVTNRPLSKVLDLVAAGTESKWRVTAPGQIEISAPWNPNAPSPIDRDTIAAWLKDNPPLPLFNRDEADRLAAESIAAVELKPGTPRDQSFSEVIRKSPIARALLTTFHALGASELAAATVSPLHFRVNPRGQFKKMPPAAQQAFAQVQGQHYAFQEALARKGVTVAPYRPGRESPPSIWEPALAAGAEVDDWSISIRKAGNSIAADAHAIAENGRYIGPTQSLSIPLYLSPKARGDFSVVPNETFELTPETLAVMRPVAQRNGSTFHSQAIIDRLMQCSDQEVFTLGLEPAFKVWAEKSGRDIFAVVPDDTFGKFADGSRELNNCRSMMIFAFIDGGHLRAVDNAFIISGNLRTTRRSRIARPEAQLLYREVAANGFPNLDTLASLYKASEFPEAYHAAASEASGFRQPRVEIPFNFPVIAVYAALTERQRQVTSQGGLLLPFSNLTPSQRQALALMLENATIPVYFEDPRGRGRDVEHWDIATLDSAEMSKLSLRVERTVRRTIFEAAVEKQGFNAVLIPQNVPGKSAAWFETGLFRVDAVDHLVVSVELPQREPISKKIELRHRSPEDALLKYDQLPKDFRDEVDKLVKERDKAIAEAKKNPVGSSNAAGGRTPPPQKRR